MNMANKLTPPQHLPDEPLLAWQWQIHVEDIRNDFFGKKSADIHQGGDTGVEKASRTNRHGILVRPE
jgi:hypothetical protein